MPTSVPAAPIPPPPPSDGGTWDFPGWGTAERIEDLEPTGAGESLAAHANKLGVWRATAICGNDITSSCLYVSAISAIYAGPLAPIALAGVALVLYLFRDVYAEVGSALPLNGGAYNVLLNTTTKAKASVAACLTILSYVATAVISAHEAMHYAHNLWAGLDVELATLGLLGLFAALSVIGIGESAAVALVIFVFHIGTLVVLIIACSSGFLDNLPTLATNWHAVPEMGVTKALFFGFCVGMLGISGFESSANFIEEQKPGVFPKTLRNMWIAVAFFNPVISLLSLSVLTLSDMTAHKGDLLAHMGLVAAGPWLQIMVSINATLVLSGAVLTSYVGVVGLMRRMSLDRCLPQFLLTQNKTRGTNHWIILLFFGFCCSIYLVTHGEVEALAGVYTVAFLCVMALFAVGNMLLKVKRSRLPREVKAGWGRVTLALLAVVVALAGNVILNPDYVEVFAIYFIVTGAAVGLMFLRVQILTTALAILKAGVGQLVNAGTGVSRILMARIHHMNNQAAIFFTKGDDVASLNRATLYVLLNEQTAYMRVVHVFNNEEDIPPKLADDLRTVDRMYPQLRIDLVLVKGKFGPALIEQLSQRFDVPKNYMFIGTPGNRFPHNIAELGGVRVVL